MATVHESAVQRAAGTTDIKLPENGGTVLEGIRAKVFLDRYALKNEKGEAVERYPEQTWRRVAEAIADVETTDERRRYWAGRFYESLAGFKFVPGGRILSGAGTGAHVTYYNCFVVPSPEDSRGGILDNLKIMTEIMARAGGVGINLSSLRPRGSYIKTVNGTASGPCSWAELYSVATGDVIQQGGSRRGALMLMLNDDHPDIEEFITVKRNLTRINHANLSVCISDRFMEAVKNDLPWDLVWQGAVKKTLRARALWNLICESAWASGEPGLVFIDRYNKESNTWYFEQIICVNPCGEQGLPEWGVCNLGAMNVSEFVRGGDADTPGTFDYEALAEHTRVAMRFLDDVIDATEYFFPENEQAQLGTRRTGLGTMGLADALIKLHVPYGSDESLELIDRIYRTIRDAAYDCSADLAAEKAPFPRFERDKYLQGRFIQRLPQPLQEKITAQGIRNAVLLTQAPTGTTSLFAGVSSGIEPVYDFAMVRRDRTGEHVLYHPLLQAWKDVHPEAGRDEVPQWFVSANDLTPEEHVRVQATVQQYTDSSISKTVNAPNDHTVEQVQELYIKAYDYGCKGVTYFRDGCREGVLSHIEEKPKASAVGATSGAAAAAAPTGTTDSSGAAVTHQASMESVTPGHVEPEAVQLGLDLNATPEPGHHLQPRPRAAEGITYRMPTPLGTMFTTVTRNAGGEPFEVFLQVGKAGSDTAAVTEALGRLISLILRLPSALSPAERLHEVVDQLAGIGGGRQLGFGRNRVRSLPDAVAQVLAEFLGGLEVTNSAAHHEFTPPPTAAAPAHGTPSEPMLAAAPSPAMNGAARRIKADLCPECGDAALVYEEGCAKCYSCGYSEC
ncbi:MAG: adenosylcobalamin-dependent ribonucleoside-diphosphate reductase [Chloroflexi bacterium]|nr:adenosylcobalamin-dependent ribonucleoside-diphosphate reductase [Chloroflexota bacterium]